jgi:hypothetical protein
VGDQYRLGNKLTLIEDQLNAILGTADLSKVHDKAEALKVVVGDLKNKLKNLGRPLMKKRPAYGPPYSKDYNLTIEEIREDLRILYNNILALDDSIVSDFKYSQTQYLLLQNALIGLSDLLKDFILLSGAPSGNVLVARDSFSDLSKIDANKIYGTMTHIDTSGGFITLAHSGTTNWAPDAAITILPGAALPEPEDPVYMHYGFLGENSNGFGGNTHEVTASTSSSSDTDYEFFGEENAHANYFACIDQSDNTWYEYELCNIPNQYKDDPCKQYGFSYKIDDSTEIRWDRDPNNNQLRLRLQLVLEEAKVINSIQINPYTPPNDGAVPFEVEDILISPDGTSQAVSIFGSGYEYHDGLNNIAEEEIKTATRVYNFPKRTAKTIEIQFTQNVPYNTDIGHIYYVETKVIKKTKKYLFGAIKKSKTYTESQRVDGDNPPITCTGVSVEVNTEQAALGTAMTYALVSQAATVLAGTAIGAFAAAIAPAALVIAAVGTIISAIFGSTSTKVLSNTISMNIESFKGWRYCIGIKEIKVLSNSYAETSEVVSTAYTTTSPIYKASLEVNDEIPSAFVDNFDDISGTAEQEKNNWIKYYISPDDGISWYRIAPKGYSEIFDEDGNLVPEIYTINSQELDDTRGSNVGYIETANDVYSMRLKIALSRPVGIVDAQNYTPIVYDYALNLYTAEA